MLELSFFCIFTNILELSWTSNIIAIFNFHEKKVTERFKVIIAVQIRNKRKIKRFITKREKKETSFTLAFYDCCDEDFFGFYISFQSFAYSFALFSVRR